MGGALVYRKEPLKEVEQEEGHDEIMMYATGGMQGWRLNMEDAHISKSTGDYCLFAVFDGHGGREVAVYCSEQYEKILNDCKDIQDTHSTKEWLRQSFMKVDQQLQTPDVQKYIDDLRLQKPPEKSAFLQRKQTVKEFKDQPQSTQAESGTKTDKQDQEQVNKARDDKIETDKQSGSEEDIEGPLIDQVGCTANVVYIDKVNKKIHVINSGDSRCVMAKGGKVVEMSIDHTPHQDHEIARILKAGSKIVRGRVDGGLNLTRSLGDFKYKKKTDLKPEEQAITANPDVYEYELADDVDFIIMGCDGIWEGKQNQKMVLEIYHEISLQLGIDEESENQRGKQEEIIVKNIDIKSIVKDILHNQLADKPTGFGCDNMTAILIIFPESIKKRKWMNYKKQIEDTVEKNPVRIPASAQRPDVVKTFKVQKPDAMADIFQIFLDTTFTLAALLTKQGIDIVVNLKKSAELSKKPVWMCITLVQRYLGKPDQMHLMWNWVRSETTEINADQQEVKFEISYSDFKSKQYAVMIEFINENENSSLQKDGMLSFDVHFKTKTTLKVEKATEIAYKKRQKRMFTDEWKESVRCLLEDMLITKSLRLQQLIIKLSQGQKEGGTSYKSIPNAFKLIDKGLARDSFYGFILLINLSKGGVGVNYEEIIEFKNIQGFQMMGQPPGTSIIKLDVGIDQYQALILRKTKLMPMMSPEQKQFQLQNESTVWLNLNEELNPVTQIEKVEEGAGIEFKIEELKFCKPSAVGNEKYVDEFSEQQLERVLDEEEFKTITSQRSERGTADRKNEPDIDSPGIQKNKGHSDQIEEAKQT